jgi:hypothetical protein
MKLGLCDIDFFCVSVYPSLHINFWMPEPVFMKFGRYVMETEPISTAYFIDPSHQPVSLCVSLLSLLRNGSVNMLPRQQIHKQQYKNCRMLCFLCGPCRIKESNSNRYNRIQCGVANVSLRMPKFSISNIYSTRNQIGASVMSLLPAQCVTFRFHIIRNKIGKAQTPEADSNIKPLNTVCSMIPLSVRLCIHFRARTMLGQV